MNHIARFDANQQPPCHGNVDIAGGHDAIGIPRIPPPLMSRHDQIGFLPAVLWRIDPDHRAYRDDEQAGHDRERPHSPQDLETARSKDLPRFSGGNAAPAIANYAVRHAAGY
jgi:hypothetical protein